MSDVRSIPDWRDATELAEAVRRGDATPSELTEAAIARIESGDEAINAVVIGRFDEARRDAAAVDRAAPFAGVPMLVKDLGAAIEGEPTYLGTNVLRELDFRAPATAHLVRRLRGAGFVILGRTNTPELGSTITTEPRSFGPTRNPWDTDRSTGGSSGGSAAAVAAGFVPVAHASDGGGSIRIPAANCGLVGLKPSRGRISAGPSVGSSWLGASTDGALTRSVRDAAALLDVLAGYEPGDPVTAPPPARPFADSFGADPGRLRVGVLDHPVFAGATPDGVTADGVRRAADRLADLGHDVSEASPTELGNDEFRTHFLNVVCSYVAEDLAWIARAAGRTLEPGDIEGGNLELARLGHELSAPTLVATEAWLHAWSRRIVGWWFGDDAFDVLLCPVINGIPPRLGELIDPETGTATLMQLMQFTSQFNITGQPAISLPMHTSPDGLPVGIQLVGAPYREDVLLALAAQLEPDGGWPHL